MAHPAAGGGAVVNAPVAPAPATATVTATATSTAPTTVTTGGLAVTVARLLQLACEAELLKSDDVQARPSAPSAETVTA